MRRTRIIGFVLLSIILPSFGFQFDGILLPTISVPEPILDTPNNTFTSNDWYFEGLSDAIDGPNIVTTPTTPPRLVNARTSGPTTTTKQPRPAELMGLRKHDIKTNDMVKSVMKQFNSTNDAKNKTIEAPVRLVTTRVIIATSTAKTSKLPKKAANLSEEDLSDEDSSDYDEINSTPKKSSLLNVTRSKTGSTLEKTPNAIMGRRNFEIETNDMSKNLIQRLNGTTTQIPEKSQQVNGTFESKQRMAQNGTTTQDPETKITREQTKQLLGVRSFDIKTHDVAKQIIIKRNDTVPPLVLINITNTAPGGEMLPTVRPVNQNISMGMNDYDMFAFDDIGGKSSELLPQHFLTIIVISLFGLFY